MGMYDQLPVYKEAYDFLLQVIAFSENIKKEMKQTFGEKLKEASLDVTLRIIKANNLANEKKQEEIEKAKGRIPEIYLLLRILHDTKQISTKQYAKASEHIVSVSKQLSAWMKYAKNNSL